MIIALAAVALGWPGAARATAPDTAWTSRQGFPVARDCRVNAAAADAQGNLYLAGSIHNGANEDFYVCRIDAATDSIAWSNVYNGPADDVDQATGCCLDSSGNLYVTGFSHDGDDFDALTIKYNAVSGSIGWARRYDAGLNTNEYASSCAADGFGNVYVVGTCNEDSFFQYDYSEDYHAFAMKLDGTIGDTLWTKHFNELPDSLSEASDCCLDDTGNVYVIGYASPNGLDAHSLVVKLNAADGETTWVRHYAPTNREYAISCCLNGSGDLIVVGKRGWLTSSIITVVKYDAMTGDTIWSRSSAENTYFPQDCALIDGDAILVSATDWLGGDQCLISKMCGDTVGTFWTSTFTLGGRNALLPVAAVSGGEFRLSASKNIRYSDYINELWHTGAYTARHSSATGDIVDSLTRSQSLPGGWNFAYDCAVAGSGGPVIAGSAGTFYSVLSLDPADGHVAWEKRDPDGYDQYHARNSKATGVAQVGPIVYTTGNIGTTGLLTYKFDATTGDTLWAAHEAYGFSYATGADCVPDPSGDLFVSACEGEYWWDAPIAIKYDQAGGDTVWTSRTPELYGTAACAADSAGAFYLAGRGPLGDCVVKYDNGTGDTLWARSGVIGAVPWGIACGNGVLYVAGHDGADYSISKHNVSNGDTLWCRRYDGPSHLFDRAASCAVDDSGFIYTTGSSYDGADFDIWTLKCAPDGDTLWSVRYDGPEGLDDFGRACCIDSLGDLYVTGFSATGRGYDMVTIKYNTGCTGVSGNAPGHIPHAFELGRPYPNPSVNGVVSLQYYLPAAQQVRIDVYNIAGQRVKSIDCGSRPAGRHTATWNGLDGDGSRAANGVYILRGSFGGVTALRKALVVR